LARFVSATQQEHGHRLDLRVIHTVSGTLVDPHFRNTIAQVLVIAE
jgi:hypothetical protein